MHLYETHLPVADTEIAKDFYSEIVGLPFAYRDLTRDIVFLWAASKEQGQIYFRDPDGHMVEFISILPDAPDPTFIGLYSEWKKLTAESNANQI